MCSACVITLAIAIKEGSQDINIKAAFYMNGVRQLISFFKKTFQVGRAGEGKPSAFIPERSSTEVIWSKSRSSVGLIVPSVAGPGVRLLFPVTRQTRL